jgi:hypothetical protein
VVTWLIHCCYIIVTLLLHCTFNFVALGPSASCATRIANLHSLPPVLLHCHDCVVTLFLHCCYNVLRASVISSHGHLYFCIVVTLLLHCHYTVVLFVAQDASEAIRDKVGEDYVMQNKIMQGNAKTKYISLLSRYFNFIQLINFHYCFSYLFQLSSVPVAPSAAAAAPTVQAAACIHLNCVFSVSVWC